MEGKDAEMKVDTLKAGVTYITAAVLVVLTLIAIIYLMAVDKLQAESGLAVITLIAGGAVTFLFTQESNTRAVRSFERGVNTTPQGVNPAAVEHADK